MPFISRAATPERRTCGPSAHHFGPSPSQTAMGVQVKDWPAGTTEASRNRLNIIAGSVMPTNDRFKPCNYRNASKNRAKRAKTNARLARPQPGGVRAGVWVSRRPARIPSKVRCAAQYNARPLAPPAGARARPFSPARSFRGEVRSSAFVTNDVPRFASKAAWLFEPLKSSDTGSRTGGNVCL